MNALRELLDGNSVTHLPGVYDPPTAALAVRAGHRAVHLSGAACAALELGLPDLGYVHGTHIASRAAGIVPALQGIPLLADADTGYGQALQAVWTAQRYAAVGIAGLHLEDQVQPKRCGHLAGKELVPAAVAAQKIRAIADAGTGLVVVARTDAHAVAGMDEVVRRAESYMDAGADAVFPEGVQDPEDLARLAGIPLVLNRSEAAAPAGVAGLGDEELAGLGVRLVLHPVGPLLAALHAARLAYAHLAGTVAAPPTRLAWSEFTDLVGQDEALALDARYPA